MICGRQLQATDCHEEPGMVRPAVLTPGGRPALVPGWARGLSPLKPAFRAMSYAACPTWFRRIDSASKRSVIGMWMPMGDGGSERTSQSGHRTS